MVGSRSGHHIWDSRGSGDSSLKDYRPAVKSSLAVLPPLPEHRHLIDRRGHCLGENAPLTGHGLISNQAADYAEGF